jgi:probable addiction module antidote protein
MTRANARSTLSRSHEEATRDSFRKDPLFAAKYLDAVLEDGDQEELMLAMRRLADAFGGISELAESAKLNPTSLYRTLSHKGNPELRSMNALLKAMGMRLSIRPLAKKTGRAKRVVTSKTRRTSARSR